MRLLWINPRWPFPADDGAKVASAALMLALARQGHDLDVVTFAREASLAPSPHPRVKVLAHHRASSLSPGSRLRTVLGNLGGPLPDSAAPFAIPGLSWNALRRLAPEPDAVVIDGLHAFASFAGTACPWPLIYRAHNVEASLWEQAAERKWPRVYFAIQARRMRALEARLGRTAGLIAAISPDDAENFRRAVPEARVEWIPVGLPLAEAPAPRGELTLGYLGRMDWPPNREGLTWFLDSVWPRVRERRPGARILIAGSGKASGLESRPGDGIEWLGRIESVTPFYAAVHAVVVPVRYGSGVKIKLAEAACRGRAAFASTSAHRGSGLSERALLLLSDDPASWVEALAGADPGVLARRGHEAFTEASALFGEAAAAGRFLSLLPRSKV